MGKTTKPTKWFKAVKKAFRSPSKERPPPAQPLGNTKGDHGDEKQLLTKHDFPPQAHPLPLFEIINHEVVGSDHVIRAQPLPTPETILLLQSPNREEKKAPEDEEEFIPETHDHQLDHDEDSACSEDEEAAAATRIHQRFHSNPLALRGLVRLQALVRGHLVRRQAAITLRTMEAIVRVQAVFRGHRVRMSKDGRALRSRISRARRHMGSGINGIVHDGEKLEIAGSEVAEQDEASKRKRPTAHPIAQQLKRTTPNQSTSFIDCNANHPHKGWAWLEIWTKTRPWDNSTRQGDSESYIEINPNHSQYTTKEVDINTKVKYYEDFISDLTLKKANFSSRLMKEKPGHKSLQIEVPDTEDDEEYTKVMVPSPSLSEGDVPGIVSPQLGSDAASVCVPETPPGILVDFGGDHEPCEAVAMEQLVLPEAHMGADGADPALNDRLPVSNGVHLQGDDALIGSASDDVANGHGIANGHIVANGHDVANGRTSNGHGDNQPGKKEIHVTNGGSPANKSGAVTCRYMAATQSAKAKFRSSSNPKSRATNPETPESPTIITKRYSTGSGTTLKAANQSPKLATRKSSNNSNRRSPSPVVSKEIHNKPRSVDLSPARRNSLGGDGKRWRT